MPEHTGPYRIEIHFGAGWEHLSDADLYIDAMRWVRVSRDWPTRIIDTPTGRIVHNRSPE